MFLAPYLCSCYYDGMYRLQQDTTQKKLAGSIDGNRAPAHSHLKRMS